VKTSLSSQSNSWPPIVEWPDPSTTMIVRAADAAALVAVPDTAETGLWSRNGHAAARPGADALVECCPLAVHACFFGGPHRSGVAYSETLSETLPIGLLMDCSCIGGSGQKNVSRAVVFLELIP
jgi:hypothetical protein